MEQFASQAVPYGDYFLGSIVGLKENNTLNLYEEGMISHSEIIPSFEAKTMEYF